MQGARCTSRYVLLGPNATTITTTITTTIATPRHLPGDVSFNPSRGPHNTTLTPPIGTFPETFRSIRRVALKLLLRSYFPTFLRKHMDNPEIKTLHDLVRNSYLTFYLTI